MLSEFPNHQWVHFACHGHLNPFHLSNSAFELHNELLSLQGLRQARLPIADLAFLAACDSVTAGGASRTPDEALRVAVAIQLGGFCGVIGTPWPMDGMDGPKIVAAL